MEAHIWDSGCFWTTHLGQLPFWKCSEHDIWDNCIIRNRSTTHLGHLRFWSMTSGTVGFFEPHIWDKAFLEPGNHEKWTTYLGYHEKWPVRVKFYIWEKIAKWTIHLGFTQKKKKLRTNPGGDFGWFLGENQWVKRGFWAGPGPFWHHFPIHPTQIRVIL